MEILNEPLCLGWLLGYVVTGRHGVLITYEAFAPILASMALQYLRFVKQRRDAKWNYPTSSVNIILTSLCWRNCYTHQNPDFIGLPLAKGFDAFDVYAPCDGNSLLASLCRGMTVPSALNIYVVSKTELNVVADFNQSVLDINRGYSIVLECEDDALDVVLAVCGDFLLPEAQAAVDLATAIEPGLGVRLVYFSRLLLLGGGIESDEQLDDCEFVRLFTATRPVLFLFCGFAVHLKGLLFDRPAPGRFHVRGYQDTGLAESLQLLVSLRMDRREIASDLIRLAPKGAGATSGTGETL
jgi:xylulose-5-phosphate/fructose-6-phosphate phosphoketolase